MSKTLTGGCLCGGVRYEVHAPFVETYCCHCSRCRRFSGTAYALNGPVPTDALHIVQGEELLRAYHADGFGPKQFCSVCGSSLFGIWATGDYVSIRMGTLDAGQGVAPQFHIFTASKAPWHDIDDGLPQWAELPE